MGQQAGRARSLTKPGGFPPWRRQRLISVSTWAPRQSRELKPLTGAQGVDAKARKSLDRYCQLQAWVQVVRKKLERAKDSITLRGWPEGQPQSHQVYAVGRKNLLELEAFTKLTLSCEL